MTMLRIIQITDLHLLSQKDEPKTHDQWTGLEYLLNKASLLNPDLVVFTGDLCFDVGDSEVYEEINDLLKGFQLQFRFIPGNHDSPHLMSKTWGLKMNEEKIASWTEEMKGIKLSFFDTSDGILNTHELKTAISRGSKLFFVHHPVLKGASVFMDSNHALRNMNEVRVVFDEPENQEIGLYFFHGHYHTDAYLSFKGVHAFISPSIYYNIDPYEPNLHVENKLKSFRVIDVNEEHEIVTRLHHFPQMKAT